MLFFSELEPQSPGEIFQGLNQHREEAKTGMKTKKKQKKEEEKKDRKHESLKEKQRKQKEDIDWENSSDIGNNLIPGLEKFGLSIIIS